MCSTGMQGGYRWRPATPLRVGDITHNLSICAYKHRSDKQRSFKIIIKKK